MKLSYGLMKRRLRLGSIDFWVPRYRWELIEWLSQRYPERKGEFERMKKGRLYAIYFTVRGKEIGG